MRGVIFGTAGHIDHGKTSLIAALTGVDCDRLPEEKRRGITLVLGFAPMADPRGELEISFIDVPGHERLVHTMIAGAGGIDRALLVVAADEGVMPQTREHLEVLELLGVRGGVVALTKSDLVDGELLELVADEAREALADGALEEAPVIACSAQSGAGLEELREALLASARSVVRRDEPYRPFRLAVDRAFTMQGTGTIVTGTARWGVVRAGADLLALPSGRRTRVRSLQVHGSRREEGRSGERVALQLGGVAVEEVPRGEQLLSPGPWRASARVAASLRVLKGRRPLKEGETLWFHLLAGRTLARLERLVPDPLPAGEEGRAVLRLRRPVFAAPGDRAVLRQVSPALTLGGARVLDPDASPVRRREGDRLLRLPDPAGDLPGALGAWIAAAGPGGVEVSALAGRAGMVEEGIQPALGRVLEGGAVAVVKTSPVTLLSRAELEECRASAAAALESAGAVGLPLAELLSRVLPPAAQELRDGYLEELRRSGVMREVGGRAVAAGLAPLEDPLAVSLEALYREAGFEAPSPAEAAARLGANPRAVEGMVRFLVEQRRLARVGGKWIVHRQLLEEVAASLQSWGVDAFDVGQFKDRFSLTRKLAIPVLEWLDSQRVTRREGDRRRVLPARGSPAGA